MESNYRKFYEEVFIERDGRDMYLYWKSRAVRVQELTPKYLEAVEYGLYRQAFIYAEALGLAYSSFNELETLPFCNEYQRLKTEKCGVCFSRIIDRSFFGNCFHFMCGDCAWAIAEARVQELRRIRGGQVDERLKCPTCRQLSVFIVSLDDEEQI